MTLSYAVRVAFLVLKQKQDSQNVVFVLNVVFPLGTCSKFIPKLTKNSVVYRYVLFIQYGDNIRPFPKKGNFDQILE